MEDKIYKLKLHEVFERDDYSEVIRVPGGWIYNFYQVEYDGDIERFKLVSSVFVPFSNEYQ